MIMPAWTAGRRGGMRKTVLDFDFDTRDLSQFDHVTDKIPIEEHGLTNAVTFSRFNSRILIRGHDTIP
jgi:hypothetical protein